MMPGGRHLLAAERTRYRETTTLLTVIAVAIAIAMPAAAQDRDEGGRASALGAATIAGPMPKLEVPSVIISAPASETNLGITLSRDGKLPANTYIRIRGLSPVMALTSGHVIAPGAWAVPIVALPDLRVVIPAGSTGKTDVHVALIAIDGGVIAETTTSIVVAPAALERSRAEKPREPSTPPPTPPVAALPRPDPAPAPPPPPAASKPTPPPLTPEARKRASGFLERGRTLLSGGDIASARLFFRRAADAGLAEGALAMGETFDPSELYRLNAIGIRPDPAEARIWYEKARDLGAGRSAESRLERLGAR